MALFGPACRLEWGRRGAHEAAARGDVLVVVDVLSFSTAVAVAVARRGYVYPCAPENDAAELARVVGGEVAVRRREVPARGRFSLSPVTFRALTPGTRVVLASPNGGVCARSAGAAAAVIVGALVNARACARAAAGAAEELGRPITVLACGERWPEPGEDGALRFALEDWLGAGAVLSHLPGDRTAEARACGAAFEAARADLAGLVHECVSGRELRDAGYAGDVEEAVRLDTLECAPVLREGRFGPMECGPAAAEGAC